MKKLKKGWFRKAKIKFIERAKFSKGTG